MGNKILNMHASAQIDEAKHSVTMLYKILPGPAVRSYGINVAEAARFPPVICEHARLIEAQLLSSN